MTNKYVFPVLGKLIFVIVRYCIILNRGNLEAHLPATQLDNKRKLLQVWGSIQKF